MATRCEPLASTLYNCCPRLSDVCNVRAGIAKHAEELWFVTVAYIAVFLPWALLHSFDFISEKWRSVKETKRAGILYLALSIVPIVFVLVYATAQYQIGNYHEMMAAVATVGVNLFNVIRSLFGVLELNVYSNWCLDAVNCLRAIYGSDIDDDKYLDIETNLKVNNTVVDNELFGTDLGVKLSFNNVRKSMWKPSEWLTTQFPKLCTVRWGGAFLCSLGEKWRRNEFSCLNIGMRDQSLSDEVRSYLLSVTFNTGPSDTVSNLFSLSELTANTDPAFCYSTSPAYQTKIRCRGDYSSLCGWNNLMWTSSLLEKPLETFKSYAFELNNLRCSYPAQVDDITDHDIIDYDPALDENRDHVTIEHVELVLLAKQLGCKRLTEMRKCYEGSRFPTDKIEQNAWRILVRQCAQLSPIAECPDMDWIPMFPWKMQLRELWDVLPNWRVSQASAQKDIEAALFVGTIFSDLKDNEFETRDGHIFEDCRDRAGSLWTRTSLTISSRSFGVVMDFVRTFLGNWMVFHDHTIPGENEWKPSLLCTPFEFKLSQYLTDVAWTDRPSSYSERRLLWECLSALQIKLASTPLAETTNLPANECLIMLFILSMPAIDLRNPEESADISGVQLPLDVMLDVRTRDYVVTQHVWSENITIAIQINKPEGTASLRLKCGYPNVRFIWQDWINASMGFMKGCDDACLSEMNDAKLYGRTMEQADLSKPMKTFNSEDGERRRGYVWTGWPVFDWGVCQFEIDQWFIVTGVEVRDFKLPRFEFLESVLPH